MFSKGKAPPEFGNRRTAPITAYFGSRGWGIGAPSSRCWRRSWGGWCDLLPALPVFLEGIAGRSPGTAGAFTRAWESAEHEPGSDLSWQKHSSLLGRLQGDEVLGGRRDWLEIRVDLRAGTD